jgi:hypothetical protein
VRKVPLNLHDPLLPAKNAEFKATTAKLKTLADFGGGAIDNENFSYLKNIGPFTDWEIKVLDGDRSRIKAIYLEFHGIAQNPD